jgi:hypothetical protein
MEKIGDFSYIDPYKMETILEKRKKKITHVLNIFRYYYLKKPFLF